MPVTVDMLFAESGRICTTPSVINNSIIIPSEFVLQILSVTEFSTLMHYSPLNPCGRVALFVSRSIFWLSNILLIFQQYYFVCCSQQRISYTRLPNRELRQNRYATSAVAFGRHTLAWEVWQLQPKVAQTVQQHVSYEFIWIRIGHVTIFSWMFTIACCLVVRLGLGLALDSASVWLMVRPTVCTRILT